MTFRKDQDYWACVYATEQLICIMTQSGFGLVRSDPLFPSHLLSPEVDTRVLGETVLQALKNSRTLNDEDERIAFFNLEAGKQRTQEWIATLMSQYGYKTKKALFKNMKACFVHCSDDRITISPSRHEKLEAWSETGINESDHVLLPVGSAPEEIGAGLQLALSRCI